VRHPQGDAGHGEESAPSRASRLPRFGGRDIISTEDSFRIASEDTPEPEPRSSGARSLFEQSLRAPRSEFSQLRRPARFQRRPPTPPADEDELEIISERALSRPQTASRQPSPPTHVPRSATPYPGDVGAGGTIDLTEDDDVVFVNSTRRVGTGGNSARPTATAGHGTREDDEPGYGRGFGIAGIADMLHDSRRLRARMHALLGRPDEVYDPMAGAAAHHHRHHHRLHAASHHRHTGRINHGIEFGAPGGGAMHMPMPFFNYEEPAFGMGLHGGNRPASPKYSPPPSPEAGFSRNPTEDDIVVCPNCGDELAVSEDEVKQQVWVIKSCGHAYCGTCTTNRTVSKSAKKGKGRATEDTVAVKPFSKCVVDGCGKTISKTSMIHVYLGT
jgi:ribosomal protein L37AE/L43A